MKNLATATLVMMFLMGTAAFADELKKSDTQDAGKAVIEVSKDKDAKNEPASSNEDRGEPRRPFHFVGHSE